MLLLFVCWWMSEVSRGETVRDDRAPFCTVTAGGTCRWGDQHSYVTSLSELRWLRAALRIVAVLFARCQSCMHLAYDCIQLCWSLWMVWFINLLHPWGVYLSVICLPGVYASLDVCAGASVGNSHPVIF